MVTVRARARRLKVMSEGFDERRCICHEPGRGDRNVRIGVTVINNRWEMNLRNVFGMRSTEFGSYAACGGSTKP